MENTCTVSRASIDSQRDLMNMRIWGSDSLPVCHSWPYFLNLPVQCNALTLEIWSKLNRMAEDTYDSNGIDGNEYD